jgi:phosphoribosylglycinamide formyltransferase-1
MKPRIAILASGGGTTAEAFIRASARGEINIEIGLVISSRQDAGVIERIATLNKELGLDIQCLVINSKTHPAEASEQLTRGEQSIAEQAAIAEVIEDGNYDLVALMGYMKRIGPNLIRLFGWRPEYRSAFQARMVNTHPGLLPDTKGFYGEQIQQYVLDHQLPYGGQTLHVVSENYDEGPVIAEHKVAVEPEDTAESLFTRVQAVEKQYLPKDIEDFLQGRLAYNANNKTEG